MIPYIEKLKLRELNLTCAAKNEAVSILKLKQNIKGFKFSTKGTNCVAVGQFSGNDFDLFYFAAKVQELMARKGRDIPDKFRFVFIG